MNSKDKGNIGEAIILAEFVKRNIQVSIPFGDNARYDLIADFNGKLNKIQVKYSSEISPTGAASCHCASSTNHTTNKHYDTYDGDVDFLCFYIASWDITAIVPIDDIKGQKSIKFRKDLPKNNQQREIKFISDYSFDKILGSQYSIFTPEAKVKKEIKNNFCIDCGSPITKEAIRCVKCSQKNQQRVIRPDRDELKTLIRDLPFTQIGTQFGVTDNTIRKWCNSYNLPSKKKEINNYTAEEWSLL